MYLLAIVAPALVLLYLGIESLERQRQAVEGLLVSNLRLSGEKLAVELERCTREAAQACLREAEAGPIHRAGLDRLRPRHPIARYFFVLEGDRVAWPPLRTPPPRTMESLAARESPQLREQFTAAFREAEAAELRRGRLEEALAAYRRAYTLSISDSLKALALSRVARCLDKLGQPEPARQSYRLLVEKYGDLTDLSHRPYALATALTTPPPATPRAELARQVAAGRWELSAELVEYFLARLGALPEAVNADYPAQLRFARVLEERFRHQGPLHPEEIYAYAFTSNGTGYQTFYHPLSGPIPGRLLGFAVNLDWVKDQLLPRCRQELRLSDSVRASLKGVGAAAPAHEATARFPSLFPFWELAVTQTGRPAGRGSLLVHVGLTVLVLCVLIMGVFLLTRDVSREARLTQIRADFVSSVSHELKTPLTLIRLYAETLLEDPNFSPDERRGFYQIITRESERLTQLIEKVLTFSRIERGEKHYTLREGDLAPVVARTVEAYGQYLRRRGFAVETRLAADLPPVRFDPDGVSQALVNLLDNAAKYSGEAKHVAVRSWAADGAVALEVADQGIGIPPEEHEKIFQRFYRAPGTGAKGGYGLGLFLVRHIMEAHGGKVELESAPGRGSRFRLVFPSLSPVAEP